MVDPALGRLGDAREDLEQRRLAGAVAPDDAEHLAALDLEADVLERPELLDRVAWHDDAPLGHVRGHAPGVPGAAGDHIAQRHIALPLGLVADHVFLAEPFGADNDVVSHSNQIREGFLGTAEIGNA